MNATNLAQLYDRDVVDSQSNKVGTVLGVWADAESGALEFIGIHTSALTRGVHVIPVQDAQIDDGTIRVPFDKDLIGGAPRFSNRDVLSREDEDKIYRHFGTETGTPGVNDPDAGSSALHSGTPRTTTGAGIPDTSSAATVTEVRVRYVGRPEAAHQTAPGGQVGDSERASSDSIDGIGADAGQYNSSPNPPGNAR